MIDPVQAFLAQAGQLKDTLYPANSRYSGIDTSTITVADGTEIAYLQRRFVPSSDQLQLLQQHYVTEGERLDNITAQYFSDPELFWRICDANNAMRPDELTETVGRQLRITLPQGIGGASV
jgi:hypothetical protein